MVLMNIIVLIFSCIILFEVQNAFISQYMIYFIYVICYIICNPLFFVLRIIEVPVILNIICLRFNDFV